MTYHFSNHKKNHNKKNTFNLSINKHKNICFVTRLAALLLAFCVLFTTYPVIAIAGSIQDSESKQTTSGQNNDQERTSSETDSSLEKGSISDDLNSDASELEKSTKDDMYSNEDFSPIEDGEASISDTDEKGSETADDEMASEQENVSGKQSENAINQNNIDEKDTRTGTEYGNPSDSTSSDSDKEQNQGEITTTQLDENQLTQEGNEQQEILCEKELRLVQDGDFVTEHYAPVSRKMRSSSSSLRNLISEAMGNYQTEVVIADLGYTRTNDIETVRSIYRSCIRGDRFYISGGFSYYINGNDIITRIKIIYNSDYTDANGDPDAGKIKNALQKFNKRAQTALEYAEQGRDPLEKVLLTHEWIVRECDYDYENYLADSIPSDSYSAYGCMVNGTAVCNGYALSYSYLLEEMGFESYILSSSSMNHAWNLVRIDGEWMHVDVTWDDPIFSGEKTGYGLRNEDYSDEGFVNHIYFLKNDNEFENLGHSGWELQDSEYELPSSSAAGLYDDSIFYDLSGSAINYIDGRFYYSDNGVLTVSDDLWGKNKEVLPTASEMVYYPHSLGGNLYYTDMQDIYCYSTETGETLLLQGEGQIVSELGIKFGDLVYILLNDDSSERYTLPIGKIQPPESVQITKYVPYEGKIKLVWEESEEADGYIISYAPMQDSKFKTLKNITNSGTVTYSHKTSEAYVQYKIRAYITQNGEKIYSDYSDTITAGTLPGKVQSFTATELSSGKTKFTWEVQPDVDGYVIYESGDNGGTWKSIKTLGGTQTAYKVGLKTEDKVYRIRAFRIFGEKKYFGSYSDTIKVYVKPEAPAELNVIRISDNKDKITWTTSEGADGYILSRSADGSSYSVLKTFADGLCNSYTATVSDGLQYLYRICAYRLVDGIKIRGNATEGQ